MINVMDHVNKPMNEVDKSLDGQLWHACAGGMVQMPELNSKVFYFPQGHAEHAAAGNGDFRDLPRIAPYVLCGVSAVSFMADSDTDEVYAKIGLVPLGNHNDCDFDNDGGFLGFDHNKNENQEKPASFAKTLTQSDANNGGGFSVPRYCAETIFPRLDYTAEPPVQTILAKDVHGKLWKFRHIYRGTPRRHLLTTGWSNFVNQKKLVAGDSIVFLRADNGDLCVGIRRAKRGIGRGFLDSNSSGWNTTIAGIGNSGKVTAESVIETANLAAAGRPFEVVYYPRASTPEFCVKASTVKAAMRIQWCPGMRFKMAFETEDSSRISWFMGTISSIDVDDQTRWPNSPWRLLQVAWDEPDLLQNVKRVSPWLVELVSNMPSIHLSPFSPPRKKLRIPQPPNFPLLPMPSMITNSIPTSIQGARHNPQFGFNHHQKYFNKIQSFPFWSPRFPPRFIETSQETDENVSCLLTIGNNTNLKNNDDEKDDKKPIFVLFGKPIFTEQQLSESSSGDTIANQSDGSVVVQNGPVESSSDEAGPWCKDQKSEFGLETGHCKIFMESEDVGRTLDLATFHSYEELYRKLADMFSIEKPIMLNNLIYRDSAGAVKHTGDEPFSEFSKTAQRLTIVMDSGSHNVGLLATN
ncbi:auxin response factor 18-like [Cynara cardunculus var. scolymus]|uniref:Auxin response factor n=1 Tax=Cynara cardunculus var. scolymus TaxID=59895 RepID=A0A118K5V9_CYNCS|nr:auxin response factor 18-like [Cynara cardunculus var. scolymus]KVI09708.1 Aux/IAA-ARF-dimerization [Cynara cardunculus var. scolymus]